MQTYFRRGAVRFRALALAGWLLACHLATPASAAGNDPADGAVSMAAVERLGRFEITGRLVGYQGVEPMVAFLEASLRGEGIERNPLAELFERNLLLFALAILGGGLLLNLTPCVLPMIPINLGVIGAGAQASSRRRGFLLGGAYGAGITLAYGALGLLSVLTGAAFGVLQASPWFNLAIAAVFVVLALAMFDVLTIDLSRFQRVGAPRGRGSFGTALTLGAVSALLAGACVAPVLIWTLLLSASLHQGGSPLGLLLPFLLGLGMALPWPFAGAGLSFLPKPGGWMSRVKQAFGVLVLVFALHYGRLAWTGFGSRSAVAAAPAPAGRTEGATPDQVPWRASLEAAMDESLATGTPLFVDLWATWCTACLRMDRTTFREAPFIEALGAFVPVKVQCERPSDPATEALMRHLGAMGLPTYVVLAPPAPGAP